MLKLLYPEDCRRHHLLASRQVSCLLAPAMTAPLPASQRTEPVPAQGATIARSRTAGRYQAVNKPQPSAPSLLWPN